MTDYSPIGLKNVVSSTDLFDILKQYPTNSLYVIMFTASWCGPCKNIKKIIYDEVKDDGICNNYKDKVLFFYVDIEENPELSSDFGVTSIPEFHFMRCSDSKNVSIEHDKFKGGNKDKLIEHISECLAK